MSQRITGTVKWYNTTKGYGFIGRDNGEDVFVHFSSLAELNCHCLEKGQRVEFTLVDNPKGMQAMNITLL
jgi:CspA family cold shock protein